MSDILVESRGLGKKYTLGGTGGEAGLSVSSLVREPWKRFKRLRGSDAEQHILWALRDANFELRSGEVLGIIGHNGAGKSTLLKILSKITTPSTGSARIKGRLASLLEVGTGFHPELSGRENIYLNGALHGLSKADIRTRLDEIIEFSGVERFLDTPVKRYSSGMYVRLAFAVAAHLEPEVLLVDEVLAVGDAAFQQRCLQRMDSLGQEGRAIILISHNIATVKQMCHRALLMEQGQIRRDGPTEAVVEEYLTSNRISVGESIRQWHPDEHQGDERIQLIEMRLLDAEGKLSAELDIAEAGSVQIRYRVNSPVTGLRLVLTLDSSDGHVVLATTDWHHRPNTLTPAGEWLSECKLPKALLNIGEYHLRVSADIPGVAMLIEPINALKFTTKADDAYGFFTQRAWPGAVAPQLSWQVTQLSDMPESAAALSNTDGK